MKLHDQTCGEATILYTVEVVPQLVWMPYDRHKLTGSNNELEMTSSPR